MSFFLLDQLDCPLKALSFHGKSEFESCTLFLLTQGTQASPASSAQKFASPGLFLYFYVLKWQILANRSLNHLVVKALVFLNFLPSYLESHKCVFFFKRNTLLISPSLQETFLNVIQLTYRFSAGAYALASHGILAPDFLVQ